MLPRTIGDGPEFKKSSAAAWSLAHYVGARYRCLAPIAFPAISHEQTAG